MVVRIEPSILSADFTAFPAAIGDRDVWLQVDGGIGADTIAEAAAAGADTFVAGSAVFGADDPDAAVQHLRALAGG